MNIKLDNSQPLVGYFHFHISLDSLLKFTLLGGKLLSNEDGAYLTETEVYAFVKEQKAQGRKYFAGCDNTDDEGKCGGHKIENKKSEAVMGVESMSERQALGAQNGG